MTPAAATAIADDRPCALGWISYLVIERPFLRLKDRFAYQSRPRSLEQSS